VSVPEHRTPTTEHRVFPREIRETTRKGRGGGRRKLSHRGHRGHRGRREPRVRVPQHRTPKTEHRFTRHGSHGGTGWERSRGGHGVTAKNAKRTRKKKGSHHGSHGGHGWEEPVGGRQWAVDSDSGSHRTVLCPLAVLSVVSVPSVVERLVSYV
jgi:hypothetical protein